MLYHTNNELPMGIRKHLPEHAQDIFRTAFNHAWKQYGIDRKKRIRGTQEEIARRMAWAAVKKRYPTFDTEWVLL